MILFLHGVEEELALHTRLRLAPARGSRSSSGGDQAKPWQAQIKFAHVHKDTATKKYHEDFLNKMYLAVVGPCILPCSRRRQDTSCSVAVSLRTFLQT